MSLCPDEVFTHFMHLPILYLSYHVQVITWMQTETLWWLKLTSDMAHNLTEVIDNHWTSTYVLYPQADLYDLQRDLSTERQTLTSERGRQARLGKSITEQINLEAQVCSDQNSQNGKKEHFKWTMTLSEFWAGILFSLQQLFFTETVNNLKWLNCHRKVISMFSLFFCVKWRFLALKGHHCWNLHIV